MNSLRILVATDQWYPDFTGGSARVASEMAHRLAARGHAVTVLAPEAKGKPHEEHTNGVTLRRALARSPLPQTMTDVITTRRGARKAGVGFDVLLAHQATTGLGLARARLGAPLVTVFHASPAREARYLAARMTSSSAGLRAAALAPLLSSLEREAFRRADRIVVLSEFSRSLLLGDHPLIEAKVRRASGGVDVDQFSPAGGRDAARAKLGVSPAPLLFTARRLEPRMGLDRLLRAVARLDNVRLVLAGTGVLASELSALATNLGLDGRITFLGRVGDEELRDWYRAADLVVLPTAAYEGFGLATVEALACGTPVVGTPVGAIPEILGPLDERLVARDPSAEALEEAIRRVLAIPAAELGEQSRTYATACFDWSKVVSGWEGVLFEAASEGVKLRSPHARSPRESSLVSKRFELLGTPLDPISLSETVDLVDKGIRTRRPIRHASVNAAKLVRLQRDSTLAAALKACDVVTADGQPVVWAARLVGKRLPERVAGIDLMEALLYRAEERGYRAYFLGARPGALDEALAEVRRRHPRLVIAGAHHGYFAPQEEKAVVAGIVASHPDMVLVALGTPEKELFQARHADALGAAFIMGVGGALDVLAGRVRRAPRWAQRAGLEWAFRLAQEPRRLLGRYLVGNARFIAIVGREVARVRLRPAARGPTR